MGDLSEIVDSLENKVSKLLYKYDSLKKENLKLEEAMDLEKKNHANTRSELEGLQQEFNSLKIANAMLGSDQFKRETKLKINSLIREIDQCIFQLTE